MSSRHQNRGVLAITRMGDEAMIHMKSQLDCETITIYQKFGSTSPKNSNKPKLKHLQVSQIFPDIPWKATSNRSLTLNYIPNNVFRAYLSEYKFNKTE